MSSFPSAPLPKSEKARLRALQSYHILNTKQSDKYDALTNLVASICKTPIALISFIDKERQWHKSFKGVKSQEIPREVSFCQYTIHRTGLTEIQNTLSDEIFINNPLVTGKPNIRFYAGISLLSKSGHAIGTLSVMDTKPKKLDAEQKEMLKIISRQVMRLLELEKSGARYRVKLKEAEQAAKKAEVAKEVFLTNMSHEIRTPLNAILGFSDLIEKTILNTEQRNHLNAIQRAGKNLLMIINDILDLSKIESGRFTLESEPFNPVDILNQVVTILQHKADEKDLELSIEIAPGLPDWLKGDAQRLLQVLLNLVDNAIKFTEKGFVLLKIQTQVTNGDSVNLKFEISDSGIGIPKGKQPKIFDQFTQVEASSTRRFGGTGLGLNIVSSLVKIFDGTIDLDSTPDHGTTFSLSIPFSICEKPTKAENSLLNKLQCRILVCEDNLLNQKLVQTVLENLGHSVVVVNNGKEGIKWLENENADLIIMDLHMPEMDGYKATEYIRSHLKLTTPILALTVSSLADEKEKCLQVGMNDYLTKPFKENVLDLKIQELLSGHGAPIAKNEDQQVISNDFDFSELEELTHGNPAMLNEIIRLFIDQTPSQLEDLKTAVKKNDYKQMQAISHNLKSSYSLIGFKKMELIRDIEQKAKSKGEKDSIFQVFLQLEKETSMLISKIRESV